jgi:hypothetical protein
MSRTCSTTAKLLKVPPSLPLHQFNGEIMRKSTKGSFRLISWFNKDKAYKAHKGVKCAFAHWLISLRWAVNCQGSTCLIGLTHYIAMQVVQASEREALSDID